jgi:hypothetical protein
MSDWKSKLRTDATDWLLEEDNPSVRYFTTVDLLGKPQDCSEVKEAKQAIMESGAEYFLKHHIYKRSHDLTKVSKPGCLSSGSR